MEILEFKNLPSIDTPINSNNLNKVQQNVKDVFDGNVAMGSIVVDDIKCRQLFDKNATTRGVILNRDTGETTTNSGYAITDYIPVEELKKYTMSNFNSWYTCYYDENKNYISASTGSSTITIPEGVKYFRASLLLTNLDIAQIEKGPKKTPYTPYKEFDNSINIVTGELTPTNEYEDGKRVYVKKIDCGVLPNNGYKDISTGLSATDVTVKKWEVTQYRTSDGFVAPIPFAYSTEVVGCYLYTKSTNNDIRLNFHSNNDRSSYTATARIYCTKNK